MGAVTLRYVQSSPVHALPFWMDAPSDSGMIGGIGEEHVGPAVKMPSIWLPPSMADDHDGDWASVGMPSGIANIDPISGPNPRAALNRSQVEELALTGDDLAGIMMQEGTSDDDDTLWGLSGIEPLGETELQAIAADWRRGSVDHGSGMNLFRGAVKRARSRAMATNAFIPVEPIGYSPPTTVQQDWRASPVEPSRAPGGAIYSWSATDGREPKRRIVAGCDEALSDVSLPSSPREPTDVDENGQQDSTSTVAPLSELDVRLRRRSLVCEFIAANPDQRASLERDEFANLVETMLASNVEVPPVSRRSLRNLIVWCLKESGEATASRSTKRRAIAKQFIATHPGETGLAEKIHKELVPLGLAYPNPRWIGRLLRDLRKELEIEMPVKLTSDMAERRKQIIEKVVAGYPTYDSDEMAKAVAAALEEALIPVPTARKTFAKLISNARRSVTAEDKSRVAPTDGRESIVKRS